MSVPCSAVWEIIVFVVFVNNRKVAKQGSQDNWMHKSILCSSYHNTVKNRVSTTPFKNNTPRMLGNVAMTTFDLFVDTLGGVIRKGGS